LLELRASVDRDALRDAGVRLVSATLKYPRVWPGDPGACKDHLKAFRKRLQRRFGKFPVIWRLGIQRRGAWHFHLLLFVPASAGSLVELRRFLSTSWYEICGGVSDDHLRHGAHVRVEQSWGQAASYVERYVAKQEVFPAGVRTGRVWGCWNREGLPVRRETVDVSRQDALKVVRAFRKLAGLKGRSFPYGLTVFVRPENVRRLLAFLGYRLE